MIKITTRGLDEFIAYVRKLPRGVKIAAMRAGTEYLIGNEQHGLRHEPPYNYVSRTRAYGQPFSSEKQQRWFFWALSEGLINPGQDNRTHDIANSWVIKETDSSWTRVRIENDAEGAQWVIGTKQAAQPAMVGWRVWTQTVADNMAGMIRAAQAAVSAWLKTKGR